MKINHIEKTVSFLKDKFNYSITRQIIMIWIKNINHNMKKFITPIYEKMGHPRK